MRFGGVEVGIMELVANISRTHKVKLFVCKFWEFKRLVIHHKHGQFWHFLMKWAKNKYLQHNMQNNNSWIQKFTTIVVRSTLDHQNLWFPASFKHFCQFRAKISNFYFFSKISPIFCQILALISKFLHFLTWFSQFLPNYSKVQIYRYFLYLNLNWKILKCIFVQISYIC